MSTHPPLSMPTRLILRSSTVRRGRTLIALVALTVAAAIATALLNLYVDLESKLTKEFRKLGPNILVAAPTGQQLPAETIANVSKSLLSDDIASPVGYAVAKTASGKPIVVVGIDMDAARQMNTWWAVTGWPHAERRALTGERAAAALNSEDDSTTFTFNGRPQKLISAGTLKTGGPEDSRIYIPIADFIAWTQTQPSTMEIAVQGTAQHVEESIRRIQAAAPIAFVQPIRQVTEAETRVLGKTRSVLMASTVLITVMVALCVLATLTASVLERRKDFAVMKALGSSQRMVSAIFLGEALTIACLGACLGFLLGSGFAAWIGRINFHAAVVPRISVFPPVLLGTLIVALLSAAIPLMRLQKIEPAVMLKGD